MAVGFGVNFFWFEVGTGDFLHSFFSTIAYRLEDGKWGTRFPFMMRQLYVGELKNEDIRFARLELKWIREGLKAFPPDQVVWDIDDLSKQPPWGDKISSRITDLSNYFVTSNGEDLIGMLFEVLEMAQRVGEDVKIVPI